MIPGVRTTIPYKGYLIELNTLRDEWRISKGGQHISYAACAEDARCIIDMLTEEGGK